MVNCTKIKYDTNLKVSVREERQPPGGPVDVAICVPLMVTCHMQHTDLTYPKESRLQIECEPQGTSLQLKSRLSACALQLARTEVVIFNFRLKEI